MGRAQTLLMLESILTVSFAINDNSIYKHCSSIVHFHCVSAAFYCLLYIVANTMYVLHVVVVVYHTILCIVV